MMMGVVCVQLLTANMVRIERTLKYVKIAEMLVTVITITDAYPDFFLSLPAQNRNPYGSSQSLFIH